MHNNSSPVMGKSASTEFDLERSTDIQISPKREEVEEKRGRKKARETSLERRKGLTLSEKDLIKSRNNLQRPLLNLEEEIAFAEENRPRTRVKCKDVPRPCVFVSCRYNLYLDTKQNSPSIKLNFPHLDVNDMQHSCALDVADKEGMTLERIAQIMNLGRESVRAIEGKALEKMRLALADPDHPPKHLSDQSNAQIIDLIESPEGSWSANE